MLGERAMRKNGHKTKNMKRERKRGRQRSKDTRGEREKETKERGGK